MYLNFLSYWVDFDEKRFSFRFGRGNEVLVEDAVFSATTLDGVPLNLSEYPQNGANVQNMLESASLHYGIQGGPVATPSLGFGFELTARSFRVFCSGRAFVSIDGFFRWGEYPEESTFSIRTDTQSPALKSATGPATSEGDNALFDRSTDALLTWNTAGNIHVFFDWSRHQYAFHYTCGIDFGRAIVFQIQENYCAQKFRIPYKPIAKKTGFETPAVGWMTWYAVQFDASEEVVLDNARKFLEKFRAYCPAPVLWVDWEWCHRSFDGQGEEGLDIFHPRPLPYPNGLAPVAAQLKQLGFLPALWIGATNEGQQNDLLKQHPDWVLAKKVIWCGQWWVDPSHPGVIQEYIPAVFRQLRDWGYQALKWDCLPATIHICNEFHDKFHDKSVTPHEGLRRMVQAARDTVGEDFFMLSCSGASDCVITCAMDIFDGARIGGDIFGWKEFLEQGVNRVMHAFPWHNTVFYADADNLVLRKELNTLNQARTRVSFYGLAGLPVTLGDKIDDLDDERTELLRRVMPVVDIHPAELEPKKHGEHFLLTSLGVSRPYGEWTVVALSNIAEEAKHLSLDLQRELRLPKQRRAVYDFWNHKFLGIFENNLELDIAACDTRVLRLTPVADDAPVLVSTSRHITQGAYELQDLHSTKNSIGGSILCAPGEATIVTILLPEDCGEISASHPFQRNERLLELQIQAESTAPVPWNVTLQE